MTRIILSIVLGFIVPLAGIIILSTATDYMTPSVLTEITIQGESYPGLLLAPLMFPFYFIIFINANNILPEMFDNFLFRVLGFILPVWSLYAVIAYLLLGKLKRFKKQSAVGIDTPPEPPEFESH